jgi:hypothetical protein
LVRPASASCRWIRSSVASRGRRFFDIFDPEGRYLGWVRQPDGLERRNAQLNLFPMVDIVYAIIETVEGVPTVKRYRLVPPGEE